MKSSNEYCTLHEVFKKQLYTLQIGVYQITHKNPYILITFAYKKKIPKITFGWYHTNFSVNDLMDMLNPDNAEEYLKNELFPLMRKLTYGSSHNAPRFCMFNEKTTKASKKCVLTEEKLSNGNKSYTLTINNESYMCNSPTRLIEVAIGEKCETIDLFGLNRELSLSTLSESLVVDADDNYVIDELIPLITKLNVIAS